MKYYYILKINGKSKNSIVTFVRYCFNLKELNIHIKHYTSKGYDVHVEKYKFLDRITYKKKKGIYEESDAYYYDGRMIERNIKNGRF